MESFLDKFIRWLRFRKIRSCIPKDSVVCDIGCGFDGYLLINIKNSIRRGIGFDMEIKERESGNIEFFKLKIEKKIPLGSERFDIVTMMAFLEHSDYPEDILREAFRLLKIGGKLIMTTPTPLSKIILETLAFKLKLIDEGEIRDHKNYFWPRDIKKVLRVAGFQEKNIKINFFELFLNSLIVAVK